MTAVRLHRFGGPEVLVADEVGVPAPAAGEVLLRVRAVGVNPPDWYLREGMPGLPEELRPPMALPLTLGTDVAGTVVAVADDVTGLAVGDEVLGMLRFPEPMNAAAYAEYVTAPVTDLASRPAGLDPVHAAALPMAGLTAWQFLVEVGHDHPSPFQPETHRPVPIGPGTRVLVNGAAGGVGHLVVQIAAARGAHVIAVASGRHTAFLRGIGAAEVVDYTRVAPEDVARDLDLVVDLIGGRGSARFLPTLRRGGSLFPVYLAELDPADVAAAGVTVSAIQVRADGGQLAELARLAESGALQVAIDASFPLAEAAAAHARAAQGHLQGKLVLTVP